ncbi:helix-turn-helix domain-containing protein [Rubrivivax albus]|uniref:Uncharacterized protein n=1 Tax=Rubrivivax albus TaxID=2499835 RepID=A0A437K118_9BURK|nr:helix-turn-helix domain-containing protein [Rubrivivax albus]RVT53965.1 hypothetical protein ENE75_03555 [Rubrivivax albus]
MRSGAKHYKVVLVPTNVRGWPVGKANPAARHADDVVDQARRLAAEGMSAWHVSKVLGIPHRTARGWIDGTRRPEPARYVARRRAAPEVELSAPENDRPCSESFDADRQQPTDPQGVALPVAVPATSDTGADPCNEDPDDPIA